METNFTHTVTRNVRTGALKAETIVELGERRELRLTTDKRYNGGIECTAQVVRVSEDGKSYQCAFGLGDPGSGDFRATVAADKAKRATLKALDTMHRECMAELPALIEAARAWYAVQAAKRAAELAAQAGRHLLPPGCVSEAAADEHNRRRC